MGLRFLAIVGVVLLAAGVLSAVTSRGPSGSARQPTPLPSALGGEPSDNAAPSESGSPRSATSPGPSSPYTFDDEFDGPTLDPAWQRHFSCCGNLAGFDPGLTTIQDGVLSMAVASRPDGWYGDLIDTKSSWTQLYGTFEARIQIPKGAGLWPAFWSYFSGGGTQAEIDTMEVCGGVSIGGGSVLHNSVFWSARDHDSQQTTTVDLSTGFHVYGVDWRPDHITFFLDGQPVWTFSDPTRIPSVPLPLILDLGVGGDFCGPPNASTPGDARMLVDWVRARP
jgi:hypothetical protein